MIENKLPPGWWDKIEVYAEFDECHEVVDMDYGYLIPDPNAPSFFDMKDLFVQGNPTYKSSHMCDTISGEINTNERAIIV